MTDEDFGTFDVTSHAEQVLRGVDRFADSVKRTLGPKDDFFSRFSSPEPSPEDLTAWGINAGDPYEVMGARVLTEAAIDCNRLAGGGATTTTILGEFILRDSAKLLNGGIDPADLQHGVELAARHAVRAVKRHAYKVLTADHSTQVGTIAADGDQEIGLIVGRTVSPEARPGRITIDYMRGATARVRLVPATGGYKILVGGATKDDAERRKARLENAIQSAQAALEEGFVAGGGAALLYASKDLDGLITANEGQRAGVDLVCRALEAPIRQLAENASVNGTVVVDHLMRRSDWRLGYDVETFNYVDMLQAGLIDPAKTVYTAIEGAAQVGTAFLMTAFPAATSPVSANRNPYFRMLASGFGSKRHVAARSRDARPAVAGRSKFSGAAERGPRGSDETKTPVAKKPARYLTGRFPETVAVDEPAELTVQVVMQAAAKHSSKLADLDVPKDGLTLKVVVEADHFHFTTPTQAPITLMPDCDSSGALFKMLATAPGETSIRISAFNGGTQVGALEIPVNVQPAKSGSPKRPNKRTKQTPKQRPEQRQASQQLDRVTSEPGDVALLVAFDKTSKKYAFTWSDQKDGFQPTVTLDETYAEMEDIRKKVVENIEEVIRLDRRTSAADATNTMRTRGIKVWQQLIPPEIRKRFLTHHARIKRITIFSDGDPIPWEMLYPVDDESTFDKGFLIQQADVSRWRVGSLPPDAISLCSADFAIPKGDLKNAKAEVKKLIKLLKGWNELLEGHYIEQKDELLAIIDKALVHLLHFACHNGFEAKDQIMFGNQSMTPDDLNGRMNKLKPTAPLVFMNACRTDGKDAEYTEIGGWANCFLGMGVGAFIGTLWEVRDASASEFATQFYAHLVAGETIAEALKCARDALRDKSPSDPTWLAYSFYGDGGAHVKK